jgi:hypothetical protein
MIALGLFCNVPDVPGNVKCFLMEYQCLIIIFPALVDNANLMIALRNLGNITYLLRYGKGIFVKLKGLFIITSLLTDYTYMVIAF